MIAKFDSYKNYAKCIEATAIKFQKMIRMEAADDDGFLNCVTCGRNVHWKAANAGHYYSRIHKSVVFYEPNCHPQCVHCNLPRGLGGNLGEYRRYLEETYTDVLLEDMEEMKKTPRKYSLPELAEMRQRFLDRIKIQEKRLC